MLGNIVSDFAAWRARLNEDRANSILRQASAEARAANDRARWWNEVRAFACGLGPWPGFPIGKGPAHG